MVRVLVPVAEGCEEMEAVIVVDILRRAGWEVCLAGLEDGPVRCSRGVVLVPDQPWAETDPEEFDLLVLPGGGAGTERLRRHDGVLDAVRRFVQTSRTVAAICAAPLVLKDAGVLEGRRLTSHPSVAEAFAGYAYREDPVVEDGSLVTSRGPGTAFAFALALVARSDGSDRARAIGRAMVL